jgi:hypothetical protein
MLRITIPSAELWDEGRQEFVHTKPQTLQLEHSLVSISKWESKWNKIFLSKEEKSIEETIDYIKCMTLTQNVDPEVYNYLTNQNIREVNQYIEAPMTASTVPEDRKLPVSRERVSSELIYYWMISLNIPFDCQKWHLNRLLMLIRICNFKNQKPKKRSRRDLYSHHAAINAANRKRFNSKG